MGTFHSAVNRIPVPRQSVHNLVAEGMLPKDIFGDHAAPGHDRLANEGWSGTIDLEMTVRTPLVFGDQYKEDAEGNRIKESDATKRIPGLRNVIEVPMDGSGRPFVSPTMVKGMVSRAYETLTASRFRVFGEHRDPLTYRVDPSQANQLFPARVCRDEAGDLAVEVLNGKGEKNEMALLVDSLHVRGIEVVREGHTQPAPNAKAPQRPRVPGAGLLPPAEQVLKRFRSLTPHGDPVRVGLTRLKDGTPVVTHVRREDTGKLEEFFRVTRKGYRSARPIEVEGYACRTAPEGKFASDLFENKKCERFFFKIDSLEKDISGTILRLTETNIRDYGLIIESYRKASDEYKGPEPHLLNRASQKRENRAANGASAQADDAPAPAGAFEPTDDALTPTDGTPALANRAPTSARFENLSKFELASLVWVLTPENLVPLEARNRTENAEEKAKSEAGKGDGEAPTKPVGFLRMGLGKPLGLGAVEVRIAEGGLKAWRGRSLAKSYESLEACLGFGAKTRKPSKFSLKKLMREVAPDRRLDLDRLPWIQAMQRAAYGYDDGVEVRYMSLAENKANNQTNSKTGEPQEGRGLSPTDLCGSSPNTKTYRPSPMRISTD